MTTTILLVEDDPSVREAATFVLERAGFGVSAVGDGAEAVAAVNAPGAAYDLMVLDLMLPTLSGFDVCREVRRTSRIPIVMLTARAEVSDIVAGLELGADDYVTKPFEPSELAARIRAVLRRSGDEDERAGELRCRDLVVDEDAYRAYRGGEELALTTMEFRLLAELVRHAGSVLTREVLLDRVWGYDYLGDSRIVDMAMKRLRQKIGEPLHPPPYVTTVRGVGYRFERG